MTRSKFAMVASTAVILAAFATATPAQTPAAGAKPAQTPAAGDKKVNTSDEKGKDGSGVVASLSQAGALVHYAQENESAVSMLAAVEMIRRVRASEGPRAGDKTSDPPNAGAKNAPKAKPAPSFSIAELLAQAKGWAKGDAHLTALVDAELAKPAQTSSGGTLGATAGAVFHRDSVNPLTKITTPSCSTSARSRASR